jgi:hypothetical protein
LVGKHFAALISDIFSQNENDGSPNLENAMASYFSDIRSPAPSVLLKMEVVTTLEHQRHGGYTVNTTQIAKK